ncbi:hypothetical protein D6827_03250, partial [Candidatus Parcubacteria bacterium]
MSSNIEVAKKIAKSMARFSTGRVKLDGHYYTDKEAYDKLYTAEIALIEHAPFWGFIFATTYFVEVDIPQNENGRFEFLAATDGRHIFYNPHYIKKATPRQVAFTLLHEAYHVALDHVGKNNRFSDAKYQQLANFAMDYVINGDIIKDYGASKMELLLKNEPNTDKKTGKKKVVFIKNKKYEYLTPDQYSRFLPPHIKIEDLSDEDRMEFLYASEFLDMSSEEVYETILKRLEEEDELPPMPMPGLGHTIIHPESSKPIPPDNAHVFYANDDGNSGGDEENKQEQKSGDTNNGTGSGENNEDKQQNKAGG